VFYKKMHNEKHHLVTYVHHNKMLTLCEMSIEFGKESASAQERVKVIAAACADVA